MAKRRAYNPKIKDEVLETLRREILAAQLKVTLDQQLNRKTSPAVKRLAATKLPPIPRESQGSTAATQPVRESQGRYVTQRAGGRYESITPATSLSDRAR